MKPTLEQLIIASHAGHERDTQFTKKVMTSIKRTTPSKTLLSTKPSVWSRLRHLPKFAVIALALLGLTIASGTVYAIYTLWPKPTVTVTAPEENQFGRSQFSVSLENCAGESRASYEIKRGSTLQNDEVPKVLQARCERDVIKKWAGDSGLIEQDQRAGTAPRMYQNGETVESDRMSYVASVISGFDEKTITLTGDEWNSPKEPLPLAADAKFYSAGEEIKREGIKLGDAVLFITHDKYQYKLRQDPYGPEPRLHGELVEKVVTHVIRVELPYEYYGPTKQNQIAERKPCYGNPDDTCIQSGGVDIYENLNVRLTIGQTMMRTVQLTIERIEGRVITAKSSSGRIFTLTLPQDIIGHYNQFRSSGYNNVKVGVGDMLSVTYVEPEAEHSLALNESSIQSIHVVIDFIYKNDPLKKY